MTIPTIRRITSTVLAELAVQARRAQPSPSSPLTVCSSPISIGLVRAVLLTLAIDAKQARDLVSVLQEAKQHIDPRLAEMARYSGGGGSSRYGGYRGRGGGGYRGGK